MEESTKEAWIGKENIGEKGNKKPAVNQFEDL